MQLFIDMDGVLADFDAGYEAAFGVPPDKALDNADWGLVSRTEDFYLNLPPMPDLSELWSFVEGYRPIVLTGIPASVKNAGDNKRAWVRRCLGPHVEVRCCRSSEKCLHAQAGDILVDDWDKYRHLWIAKGGNWVTHRSAATTVLALRALGF